MKITTAHNKTIESVMLSALKMFKRANLPTCALIEKFANASVRIADINQKFRNTIN